jgi:hypothetical protein
VQPRQRTPPELSAASTRATSAAAATAFRNRVHLPLDRAEGEHLRAAVIAGLVQRPPIVVGDFGDELEMARWAGARWPSEKTTTIRQRIVGGNVGDGATSMHGPGLSMRRRISIDTSTTAQMTENTVIAEAMAEEAPAAAAGAVIDETWAQQSFPWRMVRLAS